MRIGSLVFGAHDPLFESIAGALGGKQAVDFIWLGFAVVLSAFWLVLRRPPRELR